MYVFFIQNTTGSTAAADRFAPKYLVGNVLDGDTAISYVADGFSYFQDPGNGTGIAAALAAAALVPGDVWIRPGTYTLGARLTVPSGVRVVGAGITTVIVCGSADHCAFQLGASAQLESLLVSHPAGGAAAGAALLESPAGSGATRTLIRNVVMASDHSTPAFMQLVGGVYEVASCVLRFTGAGAQPVGISIEGAAGSPAKFDLHDIDFSLLNISARFGFTGGVSVQDSRIASCRFDLSNLVVPIAAGASSSNSLAMGNVSRGSGATLPTDAGAGNSINPGIGNIWGA